MLSLTLDYALGGAVTLRVPDMGLTAREWAEAAYAATNAPFTNRYAVLGALEVAAALERAGLLSGPVRPLGVSDRVEVCGRTLTCIAVDDRAVDGWGLGVPTFTEPRPVEVPRGPRLRVSAELPPPEMIAYAEDSRDRLWTGRGAGQWRCLTDPAGRTMPMMWGRVWEEYGPLTPLVPVQVVQPQPEGERFLVTVEELLSPPRC